MNTISDPRSLAAADLSPSQAETMFSTHAALCLAGLPTAPEAETWRRVVPEAEVGLTAAGDAPLPSGRWLRRLMIYICDTALREGSTTVELGTDLADLGTKLGATEAEWPELASECDRLLAAKPMIGLGGGAALSVFDARGRPKAASAEWRGSVRLGARFLASLEQHNVKLDRAVVGRLDKFPLALDAYGWVAHMLAQGALAGPDLPAPMTDWEALVSAFGVPGQAEADFRPLFEDALREVSAVCPDLSLVVGESGVQVRQSLPRVRPAPAPAPAPAADAAPARTDSRVSDEMVLKPRPRAGAEPVAIAPAPGAAPAVAPVVAQVAPPVERRERPMPESRVAVERPPMMERPAPHSEPSVRGGGGAIGLKTQLTGLTQVIWLRKGQGQDDLIIEVTPGYRYDADNVTQLALEPIVVQISGGLYQRDFERVSAWAMANRDLIDDVWDGTVTSLEDVNERVKKVPAPGGRYAANPADGRLEKGFDGGGDVVLVVHHQQHSPFVEGQARVRDAEADHIADL